MRNDFSIWCNCGDVVLASVGDGFVVTVDQERLWMRRRSDFFVCRSCGRRHYLLDLQSKALASGRPREQSA